MTCFKCLIIIIKSSTKMYFHCNEEHLNYTSKFLLTSYLGLIQLSTSGAAVAVGSWVGVLFRLIWGYSATTTCTVAAKYPQSIVGGTLTCSIHGSIALHETYEAGWRNLGCISNTKDWNTWRSLVVPCSTLKVWWWNNKTYVMWSVWSVLF